MSLREVFFERVKDVLYIYLRNQYLKNWDSTQISSLTVAVIRQNKPRIDSYLEERDITIKDINEAVEEIVTQILIPSIKI